MTPERIIKIVSEHFGIKVSDIKGHRRMRKFIFPRYTAIALINMFFERLTYREIATHFNNRDHSTIIHSLKEYRVCVEINEIDFKVVQRIMNKIHTEIDEEYLKDTTRLEKEFINKTHFAA